MEIWKDIKGYEGLYQVSNEGRIKSVDRTIETSNTTRHYKGKIIKQHLSTTKYWYVDLYNNGIRCRYKIHRLVATAFVENPNNYNVVDHINGNRNCNKAENLRWCSQQQNNSFKIYRERQLNNPLKSKQVYQYKNNKLIAIYPSTMEAERNGFCNGSVSACCRGIQKKYKGYSWSYKPL